MTLSEIFLLGATAVLGSALNAVAGGGTFFVFPVMVAFGMPTLDANATCAVGLIPGSLATGAAYWRETRERLREIMPYVAIGIAGGVIGGWLLVAIGDGGFRPTVPWLLAVATLTFAFNKHVQQVVNWITPSRGHGRAVFAYVLMTAVAVYGGFFGAGQGIMLLAALGIVQSGNFHRTNATKNVIAVLAQAVSAGLLIVNGLVHWPQALVVAGASIFGGYYGVAVARRFPEAAIRAVVIAVGAMLTVVFFVRG